MVKIIKISSLILMLFTLNQCATGPVHGFLFTSNKFAGEFNTNNDVKVTKTGKGCSHSILGLFGFGKSGAGNVAHTNNITRIATVDHSTFSILTMVYQNYCTIVSGEGI
ncbi:TRL-like family protein [Leptospira sp. GIMC2001]|uniref:TRL-like family protein n=1 Tax=Leptospira sp. GIMC2001 TaxID=1513297 RepID=UPI002349F887|nr:TRL-like family protein [Leptospira sp. GIMC2001]WCL51109.1 TRL-like family protein [Leptospira sp. GIMC2001]